MSDERRGTPIFTRQAAQREQIVARFKDAYRCGARPSMRSRSATQLLATLGITESDSRPHVSDDKPFSESKFKTLTYQPDFPNRFASFDHALERV